MKQTTTLLFFLLIFGGVHAQQVKGFIVDAQGKPVANSTVYIYENARGIVSDDLGQFQTTLEPGNYTCEFRSLGYENQKKTIVMGDKDLSVRVQLKETSYLLKDVVVYPGKEDPAYRIMRKAIAYAPYHRYQIKKYTSEAYIKGSLTIEKIPGIFKRAMKVNESDFDINSIIGKPLLLESKSRINFSSPQKYNQEVLALKTSIPKQFNAAKGLSIMTSSIYNADYNGCVSPLAPGAFRFYAFKLEYVDYKPDGIVNMIKVVPRKKNPNLFSGYLYILENTWNVYIADLSASELGTRMHYKINFHQVKPSVYLPTTYDVSMRLNTLGVKGEGKYFASVRYNSVEVDEVRKPVAFVGKDHEIQPLPSKPFTAKQRKIEAEIEKLSQKDNLTTKEAYKMSKLMSRITEPEEVKRQRQSLEIKDEGKVKMEVDSLALKRDSVYWESIREVPLREDEARSYAVSDSVWAADSTLTKDGKDGVVLTVDANPKTVMGKIVKGGRWEMSKKAWLRYGGLLGALKEYNFVDGFWLGQGLRFNYSFDKNSSILLSPAVYYATARKEALWHVAAEAEYAPMRLGQFSASAGHISRDVNGQNGESRLANSIAALGLGQNFIRFYDSRFFRVSNSIDAANGFNLHIGFEIDQRSALNNAATFNFVKKTVPQNIPSFADDYLPHTASTFRLSAIYTPFYRYRVREGKKSYVSSQFPTFALAYKYGTNNYGAERQSASHHRLAAAVYQTVKISPFESLNYSLSGGRFFSKHPLAINDFKYINNNLKVFTARNFYNSFNLLSPYTSSRQWWAEGHFTFQSDYLLLKNLPFLQSYSFDESVHLHALSTENTPLYLEGGYSIGFLGLGGVGVFAGFDGKKVDRVGFRISYPLFNFFERPLK